MLRQMLNTAVKENAGRNAESLLLHYKGFDIILPSDMNELKPYVWLCHTGRYQIEMGDTETGNLMRIDYFLEDLTEKVKKLTLGLEKSEERVKAIHVELDRNENYTDQIAFLEQKIKQIDNALGVNQK